jgi:trimeric autotransporter adhesin
LGKAIRTRAASPVRSLVILFLAFSIATAAQQEPQQAQPQQEPLASQPPPSPASSPPAQALPEATDQTPEGATLSAEGAVRTADGSPVPGAAIRLVNTDTKKAWVTWTDVSGKFEFPAVPPGSYTAMATQLGFQPTSSAEAHLSIGASKPIELVLRVSTLAELSESSPGRGRFGGRQFGQAQGGSEAPPNGSGSSGPGGGRGRGQLPPGVLNAFQQGMASGGFQQTDVTGEAGAASEEALVPGGAGLQPSVNLGGSSSDAFLLQGTVGQGLSLNSGGPFQIGQGGFDQGPGPGGINIPGVAGLLGQGPGGGPLGGGGFGGGNGAPFGRGGGGGAGGGGGGGGRLFRQNVNRVRFSFYDRYSNSAFNARPYAVNGVAAPKVGTYDERVGANMGGPLKIPHIYDGSDHTYFFVNYQHETLQNPISTYSIVPTAAERAGCYIPNSSSSPPIFEPFTTTPFPFNTNPTGCPGGQQIPVSATAQGLLAYIPLPNQPGTVSGQNYLLSTTTSQNTNILNANALHTINAKWNVNAAYNFNSQNLNTLGNFTDIAGTQSTRSQSVTLGVSHNWSPHVVETEQLVWTRNRIQILSNNSNTTNITAQLGINGASDLPVDYGIPQISFTNFSGLSDPIPSLVRNQTLRVSDSLSWTHGKHTTRFGAELRRLQYNTQTNPIPRGSFIFTGLATGIDFADFLLGYPQTTSVQFGNPNTYLRSWGFAGYAQDDWRITKTFTVLYGLRYDLLTPPIELYNNIVNLDVNPNIANEISPCTTECVVRVEPGEIGPFSGSIPRALIHGKYNNFEPRIGIAWQPTFIKPKTVIRAGYSIFYNLSIYTTLAKELIYQPPVDTTQTLVSSATAPLSFQDGLLPQNSTIAILNTASVSPYYRPGYAQIWSLGTETSFSQNWILDLTYTGTRGTDLDILRAPNRAPLGTPQTDIQANRIDPEATGFTLDQSGANSNFNALQVRVVHRFTHGFLVQGIYTWGKSLDDASSIGGSTATVEQQDGLQYLHKEYGLSTFDIRSQFRAVSMWELPFGERHRLVNHGWAARVLSDWRLQNIFTWQTGTPFTVLLGGAASDNGTGVNFSLRPNINGDPNLGICGGTRTVFFNTGVFSLPVNANDNLAYGDEPRGAVEGPCMFSWNSSIAKTIRFGPERRRTANFSWQIQNLTNTPNFTGIGTTLPCFGSVGSGSGGTASGLTCSNEPGVNQVHSFFGRVTTAGAMRSMFLMVRVNL